MGEVAGDESEISTTSGLVFQAGRSRWSRWEGRKVVVGWTAGEEDVKAGNGRLTQGR